jgi:pimeloyl-ACP methyl ester carboxylesterase
MPWFTSVFIEPIYRLVYGRPPVPRCTSVSGDKNGDAPEPRGLVLVADGVGGLDLCGTGLRYVLGAEQIPYSVNLFPWGHGFGRWYADLTDVANRDIQANLVAEAVRAFQAAQPGAPVFLVAKSGGSGVVIHALELLDPESVERVVLLAPALSPGYDLTRALRSVRRDLVVFWSPLDVLVLGAGTRLLGTIDRVRTVGAGMVGFAAPSLDDSDRERMRQYVKLRQIRWRLGMAATGYFGGHLGPDSPAFLRRYVVPLLRLDATTQN